MQTPSATLNAAALAAFLRAHNIPGEIIFLDVPTPTVEDAARALQAQPEDIIKSILFLIVGEPVLAIINGTRLVERRALAARYRVGRKRVKLANAADVLRIAGYPVGTVPPFGHRQPLPTLLDEGVLSRAQVFGGGGEHNAMLRLSTQDILRFTNARVVDLHSDPRSLA